MRDCRCDDGALARYERRLSGPLLDRIDMHVQVRPVPFGELDAAAPPPESEAVRALVVAARDRQVERLARLDLPETIRCNARIPPREVQRATCMTRDARRVLAQAVGRLALSARAAHRLMRVARTIADLEGDEEVGTGAMAEAVGYRGSENR